MNVEIENFSFLVIGGDANQIYGQVPLRNGRFIIGRSSHCDFVVNDSKVSSIHAVVEVQGNSIRLYDMNSKNGTFVNDKKIVSASVTLQDQVILGGKKIFLSRKLTNDLPPPVLSSLDLSKGDSSVLKSKSFDVEHVSGSIGEVLPEVPYVVFPLGKDSGSHFSEYIFEEEENLYPIFKYDQHKLSLEVVIMFRDRIFSIDYIYDLDGVYQLAGVSKNKNDLEFPYLSKLEKQPFLTITKGAFTLSLLPGYEAYQLKGGEFKQVKNDLALDDGSLVQLKNNDIEIFVRKVSAPPEVKVPPFFRRDEKLKKYLLLAFVLVFLPIVTLNFVNVDPEIEKEKDPDRIAKILYKQPLTISKNKAVEKTKEAPEKKQKVKEVEVKKKEEVEKKIAKKEEVVKKDLPKVNEPIGDKEAPKKEIVKKVDKPLPKKPAPIEKTSPSESLKTAPAANLQAIQTNPVPSPTVGAVDTFKSANFKTSINNLMVKGGAIGEVKTNTGSISGASTSSLTSGISNTVVKADATSEVGSLTGAAQGKLTTSKGVEGVTDEKGMMTAGIPSETVILGSMDPDVIRRILREHIPQFRYCYQKELEKNQGKKLSDSVKLDFQIGASGHVTKASVLTQVLPQSAKSCIAGVLKGIVFPAPRGGGVVDVKQPINFYPVDR